MMDNLISYYGFSRMPFGRDLAPGMLHRHTAHNEAVARIGWCVADRRIGVITGEVGAGKTVAVPPRWPPWTAAATPSSTCPTPPSGCAASTTASSPPSAGNR